MGTFIIITGNLSFGHSFYGPFESYEKADEFGKKRLKGLVYQIAGLISQENCTLP